MLQPGLPTKQLSDGLINVFKSAAAKLHAHSLGLECKQPARLFSMCALLSQLGQESDADASSAFDLQEVSNSDFEQATAIFKTIGLAASWMRTMVCHLETQPPESMHDIRRRVLAQTFAKSIFVATLDSSYAGAFGKQLNQLLRQDRVSEAPMSSRLTEMWMDSSQCCKYGSLLRIRAQTLLVAKLLMTHLKNAENKSCMEGDVAETVASKKVYEHVCALLNGLIPSDADHDVCNRGTFWNLRTRIVNHLIAPSCEASTAPIFASSIESFLLGELTSVAHVSGMKSSLVELASILLGDSTSDTAMTSLASALTVSAYGLIGNNNVHTHKSPNVATGSSVRWRVMAFEDASLRRKANPCVLFDNVIDENDQIGENSEENPTTPRDVDKTTVARWTSLRKRESLEMETYSEIFHICELMQQDPLVIQLRCLARAYFCYATFKASQADAGTRSWFGAASCTYRTLLASPNFEKSLLCPPIRKPDARRAQFLQCATLTLIDQSVNDLSPEPVSMTRLETQLDALGHFNKALFEHAPLKHLMLSSERSDKRWGAKIVGSFTPMLVFLLSNTLHEALVSTFQKLRTQLEEGELSLECEEQHRFPDVSELMHRLASNAREELQKVKYCAEESTKLSFADKKAVRFAVQMQEDFWSMAPKSDGWVNVLHVRSCRGSEKRTRDEM